MINYRFLAHYLQDIFNTKKNAQAICLIQDLILVYLNNSMLLWIVFAAVGILAAVILVYKYSKTSRYDTLGFSINCKTCGKKTDGLKCSYCKEEKHDWR